MLVRKSFSGPLYTCVTFVSTRGKSTAAVGGIVPTELYAKLRKNLHNFKSEEKKPLSACEKILYSHLDNPYEKVIPGESYLKLNPDRVAMQDASAQMALLQFMIAKLPSSTVPASIHCDHLIEAYSGPEEDLKRAMVTNKEVFEFLHSAALKYGIDFWRPGSGIIHQIVLENYAMPGVLMLGTDSHTPNAGGLNTIAIGVGGADAVDAMAGIPWELKAPRTLGVKLTGELNGWTSPKDVVLHIVGQLGVKGGTGKIIEYFGDGVESLSCTGMATMCNMGAEMGATTSIFPFTKGMERYLITTGRAEVAKAAALNLDLLTPDPGATYDEVLEINLSELEPHINGPFTPDRSFPISKFAEAVKQNKWPVNLKAALIGSCTNSSYQDMSRSASIAEQAHAQGLKLQSSLMMTPGSTQIHHTIQRDGIEETLTKVGSQVLANACGPCIGQWKREDIKDNEPNAILTSYNRNFAGRNDGNTKTLNFLAAPEIVTAMAFAGTTTFNPVTDSLETASGAFKFSPPTGIELPPKGFAPLADVFDAGDETTASPDVNIVVDSSSTRLALLEPFAPWDGKDIEDMRVLLKVTGKCTTDHISAAGAWLKYKGHLDNISENTLIGAINSENGTANSVYNCLTDEFDTFPAVARAYQKKGMPWLVIGDENYGEGSAREHAAMQPRYLGGSIVICRSFARIHETNLKKQGVLPLWFEKASDYDLISSRATVSTKDLASIAPGKPFTLIVKNPDEEAFELKTRHTLNEQQISWFKEGSALNLIAKTAAEKTV